MKRIGILMIAGVLAFGMTACTNDEGDPEFEILNPDEENQKALEAAKDPNRQEEESERAVQG